MFTLPGTLPTGYTSPRHVRTGPRQTRPRINYSPAAFRLAGRPVLRHDSGLPGPAKVTSCAAGSKPHHNAFTAANCPRRQNALFSSNDKQERRQNDSWPPEWRLNAQRRRTRRKRSARYAVCGDTIQSGHSPHNGIRGQISDSHQCRSPSITKDPDTHQHNPISTS